MNEHNRWVTPASNTVTSDPFGEDHGENIHDDSSCPFDRFVLNGQSEKMAEQMLSETYVLDRMAILGQSTVIYAPPGSGKTLLTLKMLMESIVAEKIDPSNVYYVNADDNFRGLQHKLKIAETFRFNMLAPGFNEFKNSDLLDIIAKMSITDTAHGKVIILDTLKKFTDVMDKKATTNFGIVVREFVAKGGTVILLSHTNKNKDENGRSVYGGTSDIVDDADCAYILDQVCEDDERRTVAFRNKKMRGDVDSEVTYSYALKENNYTNLLSSIQLVSEQEIANIQRTRAIESRLNINEHAIESIEDVIKEGTILKTELISAAVKRTGQSKAKTLDVLKEHEGNNYAKGHRWAEFKGEKNAKFYRLTKPYTAATVNLP